MVKTRGACAGGGGVGGSGGLSDDGTGEGSDAVRRGVDMDAREHSNEGVPAVAYKWKDVGKCRQELRGDGRGVGWKRGGVRTWERRKRFVCMCVREVLA